MPLGVGPDVDKAPIGKSAVQSPIDAKKKLQAIGLGYNQRERLERRSEAHEAAIDQLVYKLYDLSNADIRVVEHTTQ